MLRLSSRSHVTDMTRGPRRVAEAIVRLLGNKAVEARMLECNLKARFLARRFPMWTEAELRRFQPLVPTRSHGRHFTLRNLRRVDVVDRMLTTRPGALTWPSIARALDQAAKKPVGTRPTDARNLRRDFKTTKKRLEDAAVAYFEANKARL